MAQADVAGAASGIKIVDERRVPTP